MTSHHHHIHLLPFLLLLVGLAACHDPRTLRTLQQADLLMEEHPDSAYRILSGIDSCSLSNHKAQAYYALLITQAKIKLDKPVASDSLISIATDYYLQHKPESNEAMRALFYRSQVPCHDGAPLSFLVPAYGIAKKLEDPYWIAKTAEQIGYQYDLLQNDSLFLSYSRIAADQYLMADRLLNHLYSKADVMVALTNLSRFNESIALGDSLLEIPTIKSDNPLLRVYVLQNKLAACTLSRRYQDAEAILPELDTLPASSAKEGRRLLNSAQVKLALDKTKEAEIYIQRSLPLLVSVYDREMLFYTLEMYQIKLGNHEVALAMRDSLSALQTERIYNILWNSTAVSETAFYQEQSALKEAKAIVWRNTMYWTIVLAVLLLLAGLGFHIFRKKQFQERIQLQEQQLKDTLEQLKNLGVQLEDTTLSAKKRVSVMRPLMASLSRVLNKICIEYKVDSASDRMLIALHHNVQSILGELGSERLFSEIRTMLDTSKDNIIMRLKEQCPKVSEKDIQIILLLNAGFKPQAIALILKMEPQAVYKARARLREKISASSAEDIMDFESLLN